MEILLRLEESTKISIPDHFKRLLENVFKERENFLKVNKNILEVFNLENDYILCVLLTVALECGFRLNRSESTNFDIEAFRELNYQPKWRDLTRRLYTVDLFLANLKNERFVLIVVPVLGNVLLVNLLTLKKNEVLRSTTADPMVPSQWLLPFQLSLPERFNNLPLLARIVRRFFQKEKDLALNAANECNPSLLGIPDELKRVLFRFVSAKDFVHLTATCLRLHMYKKDPAVWKHFLKIDYKMESEDPYDLYVN
ncbi:uncharacterized protein [Halyomorpha halys]|uniref:uncharacterized protein isoform X2 n=1 Tax=Halyomorpha halys TaxID=286706 RepID=UPI0034D2DB9D